MLEWYFDALLRHDSASKINPEFIEQLKADPYKAAFVEFITTDILTMCGQNGFREVFAADKKHGFSGLRGYIDSIIGVMPPVRAVSAPLRGSTEAAV